MEDHVGTWKIERKYAESNILIIDHPSSSDGSREMKENTWPMMYI